jgi:hypothetical protein
MRDLEVANIGGDPVPSLDEDDIASNNIGSAGFNLGTIAKKNARLGKHLGDGLHNTRGGPVLPPIEGRLNYKDSHEDYTQGEVCDGWRISQGLPRDEDENASNAEDRPETFEEVSEYLPKQGVRERRDLVFALLSQPIVGFSSRQAMSHVDLKAFLNFFDLQLVPFDGFKF